MSSSAGSCLVPLTMLSRRGVLGSGLSATASLLVASPVRGAGTASGVCGAVSLTYDDGLDSQLDLAVPALDRLGLRATFFVSISNIAHRLDEWAALQARGHELADHSSSHPCDLQRYSPHAFIKRQIMPVERWLGSVASKPRRPVYAYPCDVTNLGPGTANEQARRYARLLARAGIEAARTSEGEPNNPARLRRRAYRLQALAVGYDARDLKAVQEYLAMASQRGHWAILVFHGVTLGAVEDGDVSRAFHDAVLEAVAASTLWSAPMGEAFERLRRPRID